MKTNKCIILITAVSAAICANASAQTVVLSDLGSPDDGNFQSGAVQFGATGALIFTTGSENLSLGSITGEFTDVNPTGQSVSSELYLAPGGMPVGMPVYASFSTPAVSGMDYTWSTTSSLTLEPNTEYAFAVSGAGTFDWVQKDISAGYTTQDSGWSMSGFDQILSSEMGWQADSSSWFAAGEITATPEPSTWALLGTGVVGLLGFRRRRAN